MLTFSLVQLSFFVLFVHINVYFSCWLLHSLVARTLAVAMGFKGNPGVLFYICSLNCDCNCIIV